MPQIEVHVDVAAPFEDRVQPELVIAAAREAVAAAAADRETGWELGEMGVRITTDDEIQSLNRVYRHVDRPTDVLSFALLDDDDGLGSTFPADWPRLLGDVVVSCPYAERQATDLEHSLDMELSWLIIHGTLQLLGYSHETDDRAEHMEDLERVALRGLGFRRG